MGKYKSSVHNALNLEANCWANIRRAWRWDGDGDGTEQEAEMNLSKGCQNVSFKYEYVYFITFARA